MKLICTNADCEHQCADYESAGPYAAPECSKCWSPMEPFIAPEVEFMSATARRWTGADVEPMFALADTTPAEELAVPAGALLRRQAGVR